MFDLIKLSRSNTVIFYHHYNVNRFVIKSLSNCEIKTVGTTVNKNVSIKPILTYTIGLNNPLNKGLKL